MLYRIAVMALWGLFAMPGFAAEFDADDPDDKPQAEPLKHDKAEEPKAEKVEKDQKGDRVETTVKVDKAKNDYEEYGPWQVKVPHEYRGNTFKLRIGDEVIGLDKDEITLKGSDYREKVDLIDQNGRQMSSDTIYVDPYIFDYVDIRTWKIGMHVGGASAEGKKFREILQDAYFSESSFDFGWQPGAFGLMLSFASVESKQAQDHGVESTFESSQTRLAATFEWVPLLHSSAFLRKIHMLTYAGVLAAHDSIKIADDTVSLDDSCRSNGAFIGNDLMFPIWRLWIDLRIYESYHPIEFKQFDFEQKTRLVGYSIGGSYAF